MAKTRDRSEISTFRCSKQSTNLNCWISIFRFLRPPNRRRQIRTIRWQYRNKLNLHTLVYTSRVPETVCFVYRSSICCSKPVYVWGPWGPGAVDISICLKKLKSRFVVFLRPPHRRKQIRGIRIWSWVEWLQQKKRCC